MKRFVEGEPQDQAVLFPEHLDDWIAEVDCGRLDVQPGETARSAKTHEDERQRTTAENCLLPTTVLTKSASKHAPGSGQSRG